MPLSTAQLVRYIDQPVQYEEWPLWQPKIGPLTISMLYNQDSTSRNVKPILRHITSLTDEECKECFRLAFGFCRTIKVDRLVDVIWIFDEIYKLRLAHNGLFSAYLSDEDTSILLPELFNAPALIDYLDSIQIDTRNYLQTDLAVAVT